MWDETKRRRLDAVREDEARGALTDEARAELDALLAELARDEARRFKPAMARMQRRERDSHAESDALEAEAEELRRIVREQERMVAEARAYIAEIRAKRATLAADYRRVTGRDLVPSH